jgi:hypothetical protein
MKVPQSMKDTFDRTARTFAQAFAGVWVIQVMTLVPAADGLVLPDVNWLERVFWSGVFAGVVAVMTLLHNLGEDKKVIPTLLKPTDREIGDAVMGEK